MVLPPRAGRDALPPAAQLWLTTMRTSVRIDERAAVRWVGRFGLEAKTATLEDVQRRSPLWAPWRWVAPERWRSWRISAASAGLLAFSGERCRH